MSAPIPDTPNTLDKEEVSQVENVKPEAQNTLAGGPKKHGDAALAILGDVVNRVEISEEDDRKVLR